MWNTFYSDLGENSYLKEYLVIFIFARGDKWGFSSKFYLNHHISDEVADSQYYILVPSRFAFGTRELILLSHVIYPEPNLTQLLSVKTSAPVIFLYKLPPY